MRILAWPKARPSNPYTGLVYSHLPSGARAEEWPGKLWKKYDVWHVHWPDSLLNIPGGSKAAYKISGMFAAMDFLKARGTKVVWTMHNFASHEALHPRLEPWFWRRFIPRVDGAISLSAAGLALGLEKFPRLREVPAVVIPHGHYREQYPPARKDARRELGIREDARVLMFFGAVRGYKNVDVLVKAFRGLRDHRAILYVAGKPNYDHLAAAIKTEAGQDSRIVLHFGYIDDSDVTTVLSAADVVVLPYREVLNSGSALLALSCNRPVVVPEKGSMGELKEEFGDEWVKTYRGEPDSRTLEEAMGWAARPRAEVCPTPQKYEWEHIGEETVRFFERVVNNAARKARERGKAEERFLRSVGSHAAARHENTTAPTPPPCRQAGSE